MTTISRDIFPGREATSTSKPGYALPVLNEISSEYITKILTAGTDFTIPAGAAGTVVKVQLKYGQILGSKGRVGTIYDSSLAWGGGAENVFVTEVVFVPDAQALGGDATGLNNGEYFVDYETATVYGKKGGAGTTGTATYDCWIPTIESLPLPAGAATEATLSNIDTNLTSLLLYDFATSANQTTANGYLNDINSKTQVFGQNTEALSSPVVLPQTQIDALKPSVPGTLGNYGSLVVGNDTYDIGYQNVGLVGQSHLMLVLGAGGDAVISISTGAGDDLFLLAETAAVLDNISIPVGATVSAKNAVAGVPYVDLYIMAW